MSKKKICVVITARPSYARIRTALSAIRDHEKLELQLVVAASALLDKYGATVDVHAFNKQLLCCLIAAIDERDHGLLCGIELCESWKLPAHHQAQRSGIECKSRHVEHLSKK